MAITLVRDPCGSLLGDGRAPRSEFEVSAGPGPGTAVLALRRGSVSPHSAQRGREKRARAHQPLGWAAESRGVQPGILTRPGGPFEPAAVASAGSSMCRSVMASLSFGGGRQQAGALPTPVILPLRKSHHPSRGVSQGSVNTCETVTGE